MDIPIENEQLTIAQRKLRIEIESLTYAHVELKHDILDSKSIFGWLERDEEEMSYILDVPLTGRMSEEQIALYPKIVQEDLRSLYQYEPELWDSCNLLPSVRGGGVDRILSEMREYAKLLNLGWHLGLEEDFFDPFIPLNLPKPEEDLIWEEYQSELEKEREREN